MTKILMLTHEFLPFPGGIATYCAEMAAAAAEMGHDVTVLAPDYHKDNTTEDCAKPYKVVRFPGYFYSSKAMPRVLWETLKINPKEYDIIHAAEWSFALACRVVYPFKKFPFITTLHGTDVFGFAQSKVAKILRGQDGLKHCAMVTANSVYTAKLAEQYHPYYPPQKIRPTLLGVRPWWFEQAGDTTALREKLGIEPDKKIILSVARLVPRKGHACVLEALSMLPQEEKQKLHYVIAGKADNPEYEAHLRALADQCGVPVLFAGRVEDEDIRTLYKAAWIFCLPGQADPSAVEGFGLVYLEAAAQGCPSLATVIGGVPEVVVDGKTGWLLQDQSAQALSKKISALLENPSEVEAFGKAALEWAKGFSWKRCAAQTYND